MQLSRPAPHSISASLFPHEPRTWGLRVLTQGLVLFALLLGAPGVAFCSNSASSAVTVTTLTITAGGDAAASVAAGTVVTLTATVTAGGKPVNPGQINFCDANAKYCTDIHLLATAQLTKNGMAVYRFRPGAGSHSYKAVFPGTKLESSSASSAAKLAVTGKSAQLKTTTTIGQSGDWGQYKLSAAVTEVGSTAPHTGTVSFDLPNGVFLTSALGARFGEPAAVVPEPSTFAIAVLGFICLAAGWAPGLCRSFASSMAS